MSPTPLGVHIRFHSTPTALATRVAREGVVVNISDAETEPSLPEPQRRRVADARCPESSHRADGAGRSGRRDDHCRATRAGRVHRQAGHAPRDLRRSSGHRDRERAAVHGARGPEPRADRDARAADGDERDPAGDLELADRCAAGVRRDCPRVPCVCATGCTASSAASTASRSTWRPTTHYTPEALRVVQQMYPMRPSREQASGRVDHDRVTSFTSRMSWKTRNTRRNWRGPVAGGASSGYRSSARGLPSG